MNSMKRAMRIFVLWLLTHSAVAQKSAPRGVQWVRFEQLDSLQRERPRPVFVFLHTSWCTYCQLFSRTTLRRAEVIERLNRDFYCVDFDAESRQPIVFRGRTYRFRPTGMNTGQHELATYLIQPYQNVGYPGLMFQDVAFRPITAVFSMLTKPQFLSLLDAVTPPRQ